MTSDPETGGIATAWVVSDPDTRVVYGVFWEKEGAEELVDIQTSVSWVIKGHELTNTTAIFEMLREYNGVPK